MHSIAILGDVRYHRLSSSMLTSEWIIQGGAAMMYDAVRSVIDAANPLYPPKVYYVAEPVEKKRADSEHTDDGILNWTLQEEHLDGAQAKRAVLSNGVNRGAVSLPMPHWSFLSDLICGSFRDLGGSPLRNVPNQIVEETRRGKGHWFDVIHAPDKKTMRNNFKRLWKNDPLLELGLKNMDQRLAQQIIEQRDQVPDVIVVDDLGLNIGKVKFRCADWIVGESMEDPLDACRDHIKEFWRLFCECRWWANRLKKEKASKKKEAFFDDACEAHKEFTACYLKVLFARLKRLGDRVANVGSETPIEPIVLLSASNYLPRLIDDSTQRPIDRDPPHTQTVWQHAYASKAQRRRTIAILNAETLRKKVAISSGLSWERTAQDTLVEIMRNSTTKHYLDFGFLIIRFGLTGALLIANEGGHHRYTLYFNPDHDDAQWTHAGDGKVLGDTSILVASITESLNRKCGWRQGAATLSDIGSALDEALPLAVQRLARHVACGYGTGEKQIDAMRYEFGVFAGEVFKSQTELIEFRKTSVNNQNLTAARACIQRVELTPFRSRYWSILNQSVQSELNRVAQQLVRHGPKVVLNTMEMPRRHFAQVWTDAVVKTVKEENATLFVSKEEEKTQLCQILANHLGMMVEDEGQTLRRQFGLGMVNAAKSLFDVYPHDRKKLGVVDKQKTARDETYSKIESLLDQLEVGCNNLCKSASMLKEYLVNLRAARATDKSLVELVKQELSQNGSFVLAFSDQKLEPKDRMQEAGKSINLLNCPKDMKDAPRWLRATYESDADIRTAYGRLRTAILWYLDQGERGNQSCEDRLREQEAKKEIRDELYKIDTELLTDPAAMVHRELVALLEQHHARSSSPIAISTPVFRVGAYPERDAPQDKRLTVVDRREVESLRQVKRLIEDQIGKIEEQKSDDPDKFVRPLSIAVFGPPGSGKSIAVNKIIDQLRATRKKNSIKSTVINLAELNDVGALARQLTGFFNKLKGAIPFVFFDEFDSALGEKKNGWLKSFLPVMEDGKFRGEPVGNSVFVFAGGTCDTFEDFSLTDSSRSDKQRAEFTDAKGPDFVSRLHGHINVVGINPTSPDDDLHLIRRALALRFLASQRLKTDDLAEIKIDEYMLNAFLHVPKYIHGNRSMSALVDLCINRDRKTVAMSAVPPIHQLDMQVDGKAFAALAMGQIGPLTDGG